MDWWYKRCKKLYYSINFNITYNTSFSVNLNCYLVWTIIMFRNIINKSTYIHCQMSCCLLARQTDHQDQLFMFHLRVKQAQDELFFYLHIFTPKNNSYRWEIILISLTCHKCESDMWCVICLIKKETNRSKSCAERYDIAKSEWLLLYWDKQP